MKVRGGAYQLFGILSIETVIKNRVFVKQNINYYQQFAYL